ncbi:MAG: LptF/LptG family permease [Bacteroidia bacterium]
MKNGKLFTLLDRYILKKFMGTFFVSIILIILIVIVFDISEKIEDFITHDVSLNEIVFDYYLNFIPYFVNLFSHLFTFIAVIFFTSRMASRTEIVAILSSGISFWRFLRPYLVGATIIALLSLYLNNFLIPKANKTRLNFESKYVGSRFVFNERDVHRQIAPGVFAYMEHYDNLDNVGTRFTLEKIENHELVYKLTAREIRWDSLRGRWLISDYVIRTIKKDKETLTRGMEMDTVINLSPKEFSRVQNVVESMTSGELDTFIENEKLKGSGNVHLYEIEKHKRIAYPFANFILAMMGVAVSSRKERGGIGRHLGLGIGLSFLFIFFMQWFNSYAASGVLPPSIAVWVPNMVFTVICLYMLKKAPK